MIKLTTYYGHDIWIDPARVLYVIDGGAGSRGVSAKVRLDTGETVDVSGWAEDITRQIEKAKRHRGQARELLLAIEAAMRAGLSSPQLQSWRIQLLNLRWRAYLGEWTGWQQ